MAADLGKTLKKLQQPVLVLGSSGGSKSLDDAAGDGFRKRSNSLNMLDAVERRKRFVSELNTTDPTSPTIRRDRVVVTLRVVFLKIGEIETVKECFSAEAFIQAKWREPALDEIVNDPSTNLKDIKWDNYWNPKLSITNWLSDPKETIWYTVMVNSKREALVCERRRIKGTFLENLELNEFPFDTQDISLTLMSERSATEVELEEDTCELSMINVQSFVDEQEWNLYRYVATTLKNVERVYQESANKHATLSFTCRASRRIGFFIWNIFFVMFFICSMTFTTFGVDYKMIPNRIQLTLILLLTTVTFKFTVNQSLPKISYLTYLDFYILASMVTICLICIWHGIIGSVLASSLDPTTAFWVDKWILIVFVSVFVGGHVALIVFIFCVVLRKRRNDQEKEREYTERVKMVSEMSQAFLLDLGK